MSSIDAQTRKLLKKAKAYLTEHEFEYCLDEVKEVLELDDKNYLAYIFSGKAHHSLNQTHEAIVAYQKAIEIDDTNLLAWKGLYLIHKNSSDYEKFFEFLQDYVEVLISKQEPLHELIKDINLYNKKFNKQYADQNAHACFLKAILPDTNLGREVGPQIQPYEKTIEDLLKLIKPNEARKLAEARREFPLTKSIEQQARLNTSLFNIQSKSEIPYYYELIINTTRDDAVRHYYEDLQLSYNYELLKLSAPGNDKEARLAQIIDDVKGMTTIKHSSQAAWYLYFDLVCSDYKSLKQLDLDELCWYVSNFTTDKGLANIIHGFLYCDISPFNAKDVNERLQEYHINRKEINAPELNETDKNELEVLEDKAVEAEEKHTSLTSDEIINLLTTGSENARDSLFGSKLIISYYIHLKEYLVASEKTRSAVRALASLSRSISISLPIYRRFLLLSLATIYTYFEAPKNFARALELYAMIEIEDPDDITVKIGKGIILIEKGEIESAKHLLEEAAQTTNSREVLIELAWCQIQTDETKEGRLTLERLLEQFDEVDSSSLEKKAMILWRLSESYLIEARHTSEGQEALVQSAYECLIKSLKQLKTYGPSYTSLGLIYKNYFNEQSKAIKCFYKSFELDNSDLKAAKELISHYSELQEWPMCEVLCQRILTNDNAKRALTISKEADNSWPYRVLGICYLQAQQDARSVEYFQNAIRINKSDKVSWSCLGEAYFSSGRYEAALKVYEHCLQLSDQSCDSSDIEDWYILYMLASIHSCLENFTEAVDILENLLMTKSDELAIIILYCQVLTQQASFYISNGFTGRGINAASKTVDIIHSRIENEAVKSSQAVWKSLSDALNLYLYTQQSLGTLDIRKVQEVIARIPIENEFLLEAESGTFNEEAASVDTVTALLIESSKREVEVVSSKSSRELRATVFYNLGLNYLHGHLLSGGGQALYLKSSIKTLRKAIQLDDKEPSYWTALGLSAFLNSDVSFAQHCLIKSLALAPKDPVIWSNLAILYVKHKDIALAKETFTKIQSLVPASNVGWMGNAIIQDKLGDKEEAYKHFTHGFVLSNGRSTAAQLFYAGSVVEKTSGKRTDERDLDTVQELTSAAFAIFDYLKKFPTDVFAIHIGLSVIERLGDYKEGIQYAEKLCDLLEVAYETTEDEHVLIGFASAKSTLARLLLGAGQYDLALESAQFALDLSEGTVGANDEEAMRIILSSRVVVGLSLFFQHNFDGALEQLRLILVHEQSQPSSAKETKESLLVLVSQILYANGTEDSIQASLDELFTFIEENGSTLLVALTLGIIALVENTEDILLAVRSDLLHLKLSELIDDSSRQVPYFISQINRKLKIEDDYYDKRSAFMFPNDVKVWQTLNATMSVAIGSGSAQVNATTLSDSLVTAGNLRQIQRGLFLNPANLDAYRALKLCLT